MIFQLDSESIDRSSTLTSEDIGKWCFIIDGTVCGFYSTWAEANEAWGYINS